MLHVRAYVCKLRRVNPQRRRSPRLCTTSLSRLSVVLRTAVEWPACRVPSSCSRRRRRAELLRLQRVRTAGQGGAIRHDDAEGWTAAASCAQGAGRRALVAEERLIAFIPARSALINASFFARVQPLICCSRARASSIDAQASAQPDVERRWSEKLNRWCASLRGQRRPGSPT